MLVYWGDKKNHISDISFITINMLQKNPSYSSNTYSLLSHSLALTPSHRSQIQCPTQSTPLHPLLSFSTNCSNIASILSLLPLLKCTQYLRTPYQSILFPFLGKYMASIMTSQFISNPKLTPIFSNALND